jgi:carotenoid cleavage dioxygenase-like enzyme
VAGDVYPIRYTADSFFFLHTINAYEEKDQVKEENIFQIVFSN